MGYSTLDVHKVFPEIWLRRGRPPPNVAIETFQACRLSLPSLLMILSKQVCVKTKTVK